MTLLHTTQKILLNNAMLKAVGVHEKWSRSKKIKNGENIETAF